MDISLKKYYNEKPVLWLAFLLYLFLSGYAIIYHEMWGDEIHSWNIAKGSEHYSDLIHNTRFEGHPPVWYTILWFISKCSHNLQYVQLVHWLIASTTVALLLFFSRIPTLSRTMIPFGYFFLYEYAVLSRNYAIGILLACCICMLLRRKARYQFPLYYLLLLLMSNTHLLALVLAGCMHIYFLVFQYEQNKGKRRILVHVLAGILVFLPALYFIFPPSDSQLNTSYWFDRWNAVQIKAVGQAPLRSFIPIPAWWSTHFWNTQFLLDSRTKSRILNLGVAMVVLSIATAVLWRNKKSLLLFLTNLFLSFLLALLVFPLTSARYAGFLYIGFIIAFWLYCYEAKPGRVAVSLLNILLFIHVFTGLFLVAKDISLPFSNAYRVNELLSTPPRGSRIVTDYWAMNTISAFADRPIFCIDVQRDLAFVLWGPELGKMFMRTYRYCDGIKALFQKEGRTELYMISTGAPQALDRADRKLFKDYHVSLVDKREGAIEKGGNLYLYRISSN